MRADDKIKAGAEGALGQAPADLATRSRGTHGTNTYVALKGDDGKEFNCIITGGNLLARGMSNPPSCARTGEPGEASLPGG